MIRKDIYNYYWFGTSLRYLQDADAEFPLDTQTGTTPGGIRINLDEFFRIAEELGLQVTLRAASGLDDLRTKYAALPADHKLTATEAAELRRAVNKLRPTLDAELMGFEAFVVTPKRMDVAKLIDNVPALLAPGVFSRLPPLAQFDLSEAGKCIAFERSTAAAFHLMRAVEGTLRAFYKSVVKTKRKATLWGPIVVDIRSRKVATTHSIVLNNLDHIRVSFRNPTQHPEATFDVEEAQDLWSLSIDSLNRMAKVLPMPGT